MTIILLPAAEEDLDQVYNYYQLIRRELADEMMDEFRRGVEQILKHPRGWQLIGRRHRAYRLDRFPYRIVYHEDSNSGDIVISNFTHLHRRPRKPQD